MEKSLATSLASILPEYQSCVESMRALEIPDDELEIVIAYFALDGSFPRKMEELARDYGKTLDEVDLAVHNWYPCLVDIWLGIRKARLKPSK
jgi:hypothetical protein